MRTFAWKSMALQSPTSTRATVPGRAHFGYSREADSMLHLQRAIGNQAVQRPLEPNLQDVKADRSSTAKITRFGHDFSRIPVHSKLPLKIQTKLSVSTPGDEHEQEADRVADSVMAADTRPVGQVAQGVQRKLYRMELRPEDMVDSMPPSVEELAVEASESDPTEEVQRSASVEAEAVPAQFERTLQQASDGGGAALSAPTKAFMESRFGRDFSAVRVHNDARANMLARDIKARAFTLDSNIFFANSQYQPDSHEGRHLLAHELTHVVQQSEGQLARQIQRQTSCSSYNSYNTDAKLNTYNCAGLATRTYQFIAPVSAVYDSILANFMRTRTPSGKKCSADQVKFWLWEYDLHLEDDSGNRLSPGNRDFHIVAGRTDLTGADPTDVYSKNGMRRVYGPGTGPGFRPATRDRALSNDASETPGTTSDGRPVFKVRSKMSEAITCTDCYP